MIDGREVAWFLVHTNPRCEDRAAKGLVAHGIEVYAPKATRWVRPRRRKTAKRQRATSPAFPRYLFVGLHRGIDWALLRATDGVAGVVCMGTAPVRVDPVEIDQVRAAEDMGCFDFTTEMVRVKVGGRVMLTAGPLDGYTATVTRVPKGEDKPVEVDVEIFGRQVPTVVPLDKLRVLA